MYVELSKATTITSIFQILILLNVLIFGNLS